MQDDDPDKKTAKAIARVVKAMMARRGKSQKELRERLNWSVSYTGRRMGGEIEFSLSELIAIGDFLDCDPADLVLSALDDLRQPVAA